MDTENTGENEEERGLLDGGSPRIHAPDRKLTQQNVLKVQSRSREQQQEKEGTDSHEDTVIKRPCVKRCKLGGTRRFAERVYVLVKRNALPTRESKAGSRVE